MKHGPRLCVLVLSFVAPACGEDTADIEAIAPDEESLSSPPVFRSVSKTYLSTSGATSITLGAPSGSAAGDVLIASLSVGGSQNTTLPTITAPTGWTLVRRVNHSTVASLAVYWHAFVSGETAYQFTFNGPLLGTAIVAAYSGANAAGPIDVEAGQDISTGGTSISTPSLTTTGANEVLVASFAAFVQGGTGTQTWTAPSGMSLRASVNNTDSRSSASADQGQATAGATGVKTATTSPAATYALSHLLALKPAAVGDGGASGLGATYYMAVNGRDDNPGTVSLPWATLSKAHSVLQPGDTLRIRGGTYTSAGNKSLEWTKSGTAGKPITIRSYPGERPIFDGNQATWFVRFYNSRTVSDLVFDGLEMTDFSANAFRIHYGKNIVVRNCKIHDLNTYQSGAIVVGAYGDSVLAGILIENCRLERIGANGTRGQYVNGDHMIYLSTMASNVTIRNNFFKDAYSGYAIHQYHAPNSTNVSIYNNVFILTTGHIRSALRLEGGTNFQFKNNTVVTASSGSDATYGIRMGGGTMVAENNIFYGSTTGGYIYKPGGTLSADYNLYWPEGLAPADKATHSLRADPSFVNVASDWHLRAGSAAIDRGFDSGLSFDADGNARVGAPDLGAYEHTVVDGDAPSVPTALRAAAAGSSAIEISWTASTDNVGVAGYQVHRNGALVAVTTATRHTDTGLEASTAYSYAVAAFDDAENVSALSAPASAATAPAAFIVDNGTSGTSSTGTWSPSAGTGAYGAGSLYGRNGASYSWHAGLPQTGVYEVHAWWTTYADRSTSAPYTVTYSGGSWTTHVNQQLNGGRWVYLGSFNFNAATGGTVRLSAPSTTASYCADAVKFVRVPGVIVDNGASGTSSTGAWDVSSASGHYGANSLYASKSGSTTPTYAWSAALPRPGFYDVYAWWTTYVGGSSRSTAAPYTITHSGGAQIIKVNQAANGGRWNKLGTFGFGTTGKVTLTASDVYPVVESADAVMFVYRP